MTPTNALLCYFFLITVQLFSRHMKISAHIYSFLHRPTSITISQEGTNTWGKTFPFNITFAKPTEKFCGCLIQVLIACN
jgi:hypothetical protein